MEPLFRFVARGKRTLYTVRPGHDSNSVVVSWAVSMGHDSLPGLVKVDENMVRCRLLGEDALGDKSLPQ